MTADASLRVASERRREISAYVRVFIFGLALTSHLSSQRLRRHGRARARKSRSSFFLPARNPHRRAPARRAYVARVRRSLGEGLSAGRGEVGHLAHRRIPRRAELLCELVKVLGVVAGGGPLGLGGRGHARGRGARRWGRVAVRAHLSLYARDGFADTKTGWACTLYDAGIGGGRRTIAGVQAEVERTVTTLFKSHTTLVTATYVATGRGPTFPDPPQHNRQNCLNRMGAARIQLAEHEHQAHRRRSGCSRQSSSGRAHGHAAFLAASFFSFSLSTNRVRASTVRCIKKPPFQKW